MNNRQCGGCSLCCKLLPMDIDNLHKPAGKRCPHQRHSKGCAIYARRPHCCRLWNCRWLAANDTDDLRRPDRSHYVLDIMPDFVTLEHNETHERTNIQVVQVWCDPDYPDAWKDPALLAYLERRGKEGTAALVRFNSRDAITVFPPAMCADGQWHANSNMTLEREHTAEERWRGIASSKRVTI